MVQKGYRLILFKFCVDAVAVISDPRVWFGNVTLIFADGSTHLADQSVIGKATVHLKP